MSQLNPITDHLANLDIHDSNDESQRDLVDEPAASSTHPSQTHDKPKIYRNADTALSETRPSRFVKPAVPPLYHPDDVPPDLQPVLKLYECYNTKVYAEDYIYKMNDITPEGKSFVARDWTKCYVELCGPILTLWDAADTTANDYSREGESGTLRPTFINITDSAVDVYDALHDQPPREHVFALNSAGANRFLLQTTDNRTLNRWVSAIRLSCFEISKLHEIYTRTLLSRPSLKDILDKHSAKFEGYLQVRFTGSTEWQRYWVVVSDKRDEKKIFGKKPVVSRGQCLFFETKKSKNPIMTLVNVFQAYAVYPETPHLVEKATMFKVEGSLFGSTKSSSPTESKPSSFVLMMTSTTKEMASWLVATFDAFKLYGRPNALLDSFSEPKSMCFAQPSAETDSGRLFLELEEVEHIPMRGETLADIKMVFNDILQSKTQPRQSPLLPPIRSYGQTPQFGNVPLPEHRNGKHDGYSRNRTMSGGSQILQATAKQRLGEQPIDALRPSFSADSSRNRSTFDSFKKGRKVADSSDSEEELEKQNEDDSEEDLIVPRGKPSMAKIDSFARQELPQIPTNSTSSSFRNKKVVPAPSDSEDDDVVIDSDSQSDYQTMGRFGKNEPKTFLVSSSENSSSVGVNAPFPNFGSPSTSKVTRSVQQIKNKPLPAPSDTEDDEVGSSVNDADSEIGTKSINSAHQHHQQIFVNRRGDAAVQQQQPILALPRPMPEGMIIQNRMKRPTSIATSTTSDMTEEKGAEGEDDEQAGTKQGAPSWRNKSGSANNFEFGEIPKMNLDFSAVFDFLDTRPSTSDVPAADHMFAQSRNATNSNVEDYGKEDLRNQNDDVWGGEPGESKDRRSSQQHESFKVGPTGLRRSSLQSESGDSASGSRTSLTGSSAGSESSQPVIPHVTHPQKNMHDRISPRSQSPAGFNPIDRRWNGRPPPNTTLPSSTSAYGDYEQAQGPVWDNEMMYDPRLMGRGSQGGMYYDDDDYQSVSGDPRRSPGGVRRGYRNDDTYSLYDYDEPRARGPQATGAGQNFKHGSLLGMHMSEQFTVREQTEFARATGQPLINVPIKPPEPQTGLVGMITQREQQRKNGSSQRIADITGAMQEAEREKSLEREREWRLLEQRQQFLQQQQQAMMMMGAYGMMGMPMGNQYMGNMGMLPMGGQYLDPRYAMGMAQMPVGAQYLDPRLPMMGGAGIGVGQIPVGMSGQYIDPRYTMYNSNNMGIGQMPGYGNRSGSVSGPSYPSAVNTIGDEEDDHVPIGMANSPLLSNRSSSPALGDGLIQNVASFTAAKEDSENDSL
ncbi:hypothetical protein BC937DRAFT_95107 [Endogone sp. FLAS-F59071]|nr:hypothetical protein BC937DRAFT_95107 [Endogone sp. FLAS-F59071]|eukprot:RUS20485.1 hypothetical protein BC937DRAFT_95107 [Endogone sp. FLAS-F59071]